MLIKIRAFLQKVKTFLFKGWLVEALFVTIVTVIITIIITYASDSLYKGSFGKKTFSKGKLTIVGANGSNSPVNTNETQNNSSSTDPTSVPTTTLPTSGTQTSSPTTNQPTVVSPPASPPPSTPPSSPPPAPSGCFVTVNGYLYNMQSAIGLNLTDPNTSKTRKHTSGSFNCGSFSSPTNMTSTYLSKHSGMGCAQRLAPYIYTPPAPTDPSC